MNLIDPDTMNLLQPYMIICNLIIYGLVIFFIFKTKKSLLSIFTFKNKLNLSLFISIIIFFIILCLTIGYNLKSFIPSDQEWELLYQGAQIVRGEEIFSHIRYGLTYPVLISFGILLFGPTPIFASLVNLFFGLLSVILVYGLAKLAFNKERLGLIAMLLYAFHPLTFIFTSTVMGFPILATFLLVLILITLILFVQKKELNLFYLNLALFALLAQLKPEFFILIIPLIVFYFIGFKKKKKGVSKKIFLAILIFLLLSAPYFIKNTQFKLAYSSHFWCGYPTQAQYEDQPHYYNLPLVGKIDPLIHKVLNARFSINYFIYDLPTFYGFWTFKSLAIISILIILGLFIALKRKEVASLMVFSFFIVITSVYLLDCAFAETRYLAPTYAMMVVFAGLGLYTLTEIRKNDIYAVKILKCVILALILILLALYWINIDYKIYIKQNLYHYYLSPQINPGHRRMVFDDYSAIADLTKGLPTETTYLITAHPNSKYALAFLGYQATSLICIENDHRLIGLDPISLPLKNNASNYFIESKIYCAGLDSLKRLCQMVKDNYQLQPIKENDLFRIYKIGQPTSNSAKPYKSK